MKRSLGLPPHLQAWLDRVKTAILKQVDWLLNKIFGLTHKAARFRSAILLLSFLGFWLLFALTAHTPQENTRISTTWFQTAASGLPQDVLLSTLTFFVTIFLNSSVVRHMLALYVPFWLMNHVAAIYLADIFEKDEAVAHKFILQAAFAESYNTIHIRQGVVIDEDRDSPMIQIGGPGYVVVELDSAVLFERPDGSTHIIGPTTEEWHGSKLITGFERIRQGFDLRDAIQKYEVKTRSSDGILVSARDIQYSYSIYRGRKPVKTPKTPFPYDEAAILKLVYDDFRPVKLNEATANKPDWLEPQPGKIYGPITSELGGFINKHGLSDILVTVGKPEEDSLEERKKELEERIRSLSTPDEPAEPEEQPWAGELDGIAYSSLIQPDYKDLTATTEARTILTNLLYKNFQEKAAARGIQLYWIGVGTWDTPTQIIPKNHREAWKISRENFTRGNPTELQRIYDESRLSEQIQLIENSVIRKVYNEIDKHEPDEKVIKSILNEYLIHLDRAREQFRPNIPEDISKAINRIQHWISPSKFHSVSDED